ncbi:hypothetical protein KQR57_21870 [Bacillus inaquosorum]|nr:hypothetical protein [Bacillus inaquosorum]
MNEKRFKTLRFQLLFRSLCILVLLLVFVGAMQYVFGKRLYMKTALSAFKVISTRRSRPYGKTLKDTKAIPTARTSQMVLSVPPLFIRV